MNDGGPMADLVVLRLGALMPYISIYPCIEEVNNGIRREGLFVDGCFVPLSLT